MYINDISEEYNAFDNFWYKARRNLLKILLNKYKIKNSSVAEVGCGARSQLLSLKDFSDNLDAYDIDKDSVALASKLNVANLFVYNIESNVLPKKYNIICSFDVLEHIGNDSLAIKNIYNSLYSQGLFFFSVPVCKLIFSGHDKSSGHFRRYSKLEIKNKLEKQGFEIIELYYWNSLLFPFLACKRLLSKNNNKSDISSYSRLENLLFKVLSLENFLIKKGCKFLFGASLIGVARRS